MRIVWKIHSGARTHLKNPAARRNVLQGLSAQAREESPVEWAYRAIIVLCKAIVGCAGLSHISSLLARKAAGPFNLLFAFELPNH
jgi:hypothetical protein